MKFSITWAVSALTTLVAALPPNEQAVQADWDVIIVGGGPSGLAAASGLARVRRNVLLVDSGEYRNAPTRHVHDVLGFDGVTPAWFRYRARQQISQYPTVSFTNGTVQEVKATPEGNNTLFTVTTTYGDGTSNVLRARKIVLGTGLKDLIPNTPSLDQYFGKGVWWCPWCDGYEHADQALGVLGSLERSTDTPLEVLNQNTDIIIFTNGTDTPDARERADAKFPGWEKWFQLHNITVENRKIVSVERLRDGGAEPKDPSLSTAPEFDLFRVNFEEGGPVERQGFITNWDKEQRSDVGEKAGVEIYDEKMFADSSKGLVTNIKGIFAVGDANTDNSTNVPHAMWSGKRAAVTIHVELERENANFQIAQLSKREADAEMRSLWARVNEPGDFLHGGRFDDKW